MKPEKNALNTIIVSLIFAIAILLSSWLIEDKKQASVAMFALIALWFVPYSYFATKGAKEKNCKNCDPKDKK